MSKYTIISDVGRGILELLRDKLVPEVIDKSESIGICDAKDRGGYIVGIHPYDIREDTSNAAKEPKTLPDGSVQDPPAMMELYYAISVSSKAEIESKSLDEARIIGKIIQVFKDNPVIPNRYLPSNPGMPLENVSITMLPLNMEEKVKIWTMFGESYKLSVFYVVGPVAIDSENIKRPTKRVEKVYVDSKQYEYKEELHFDTFIKEEDIDDEYTHRPDEDEDQPEEDGYGNEYGEAGADNGYGEAGADNGYGEAGADNGYGEAGADNGYDEAGADNGYGDADADNGYGEAGAEESDNINHGGENEYSDEGVMDVNAEK